MDKLEKLFKLGLIVQPFESFKLLCCELKQWAESEYRAKLRNHKLASAITNQLKNNIYDLIYIPYDIDEYIEDIDKSDI